MSEMAGYIVTETDRVNGLISNFLDFARPLQIHPVISDLHSVIADVVRQQSDLATKKEVTVFGEGGSQFDQLLFDPDLLKIALSNLSRTRFKPVPPDQTVEIRAEPANENVRIVCRRPW